MRVLALEPFYGGSHAAFLNGWRDHSRHDFTILGLPAYKWKWRMRHGAVTFAKQLQEEYAQDSWDVVWCSDMLNLAEVIGLISRVRPDVAQLPRVAYFHENQLTYPVREEKERDLHFAYSNFTTCIAADQVWFNSRFHQKEFLTSLRAYLKRMPDYRSLEVLDEIESKSSVQYPGISVSVRPSNHTIKQNAVPRLHIGWASRWEHDKNPEDFFRALRILKSEGTQFRLSVLGQSFQNSPSIFETAFVEFENEIENWGFVETPDAYHFCLSQLDVIVSTARHEFFGIGVVEAIRCGAAPLLPDRLAYPEVLGELQFNPSEHLYDGSVEDLVHRLRQLAVLAQPEGRRSSTGLSVEELAGAPFDWTIRSAEMDQKLEEMVSSTMKNR